jgi:hypothetical protein
LDQRHLLFDLRRGGVDPVSVAAIKWAEKGEPGLRQDQDISDGIVVHRLSAAAAHSEWRQPDAQEKERMERRQLLEQESAASAQYWAQLAKDKQWDCVKADMEVYSHSGQTVTDDPRRTERYREAVINQLKLDEAQWEASRPDLSRADRDVLVEVVRRNAAMFWFDGEQ